MSISHHLAAISTADFSTPPGFGGDGGSGTGPFDLAMETICQLRAKCISGGMSPRVKVAHKGGLNKIKE